MEGRYGKWILKKYLRKLERETGFEPATLALARRCSTTELFPRPSEEAGFYRPDVKTVKPDIANILPAAVDPHAFMLHSKPFAAQIAHLRPLSWSFDSDVPASSVHLTDLRGLSRVNVMSLFAIPINEVTVA